MLDIHRTGSLTRDEVKSYLEDKCQSVNMAVVDHLLDEMHWVDGRVNRREFCGKYREKERKLAAEVNRGRCYEQVLQFNQSIFEGCGAQLYGYLSIYRL